MKLYYEPDMSDFDRADMLDNFAKALSCYPKWAVAKGFDRWERDGTRRPSPGEVGILAGRAVKEITDELANRSREIKRQKADSSLLREDLTPEIMAQRREHAARVLARFSYTNHMATATEGPKPPPDPTPPTPDEIAETMAIVNAKSAVWAQEKARQDAVARELQAMGLDVLLQKPAKEGALS